ncbi:MAG: hypothetical protein DRH04_02005 [Deltaproteobacteria bacterium]|nr:MAG: hypothetical protein DRH04_02005 [Deltaproteobacteria bacterium]
MIREVKQLVNIKRDPNALRSLIDDCIEGQPYAWDDFFTIFTVDIIRHIRNKFISLQRKDLAADPDVVDQVFQEVAKKLYADNCLADIKEVKKRGRIGVILAWLKQTSQRKAQDFHDKQKTQKNLSTQLAGKRTTSLDEPLDKENPGTTKHDIIKAAPEDHKEDDNEKKVTIEQIFAEAWNILAPYEWWILRLKLIFASPLLPDEIKKLAGFTGLQVSLVEGKIDQLMDAMINKQEQKEKQLKNIDRLLSVIHLNQYILLKKSEDDSLESHTKQDIEAKITHAMDKVNCQQTAFKKPLLSANRDIAEILGAENAKHIAVQWHRLKNKLAKILTP